MALRIPVVQLRSMLTELFEVNDPGLRRAVGRMMDAAEAKAVEITPVDTGHLESSSVVDTRQTTTKVEAILRFGASYAAEVHELPEHARGEKTRAKTGNEFGPAGPKYVERVLRGFPWRRYMTEELGRVLRDRARAAARAARPKGRTPK